MAKSFFHHDWYSNAQLTGALACLLENRERFSGGKKLADMGCGNRPYEGLFVSKGYEYVGCDIGDRLTVDTKRIDVLIEEGKAVPIAENSVDVVLSVQVLEHVWDVDWYLKECLRILKPGGRLVLSTHGNWLYHPHPTDYRRWTRDGLTKELAKAGFGTESVVPLLGPLAWTTLFQFFGVRKLLKKIPFLGDVILAPLSCLTNLVVQIQDRITPPDIIRDNAAIYLTVSTKPSGNETKLP